MTTNDKALVPVKSDSFLTKIKKILMFVLMDGKYHVVDNSMKAEEYQDEDKKYQVYLKYKDSFEKEKKFYENGNGDDPEDKEKQDKHSIEVLEEKYRKGDLSLMDFTYVEINSLNMYYLEKIKELKEINGMRKKKIMERQRKSWE